jgi:hypothetical protein
MQRSFLAVTSWQHAYQDQGLVVASLKAAQAVMGIFGGAYLDVAADRASYEVHERHRLALCD